MELKLKNGLVRSGLTHCYVDTRTGGTKIKGIKSFNMNISKAFFIKLGKSGIWEEDSIYNNRIRIGWEIIPLELIEKQEWEQINIKIKEDFEARKKKTGWTNDFNALKSICTADSDTVFITFYGGKMWWTKIKCNSVKQDETSKYFETSIPWSDRSINGRLFELNGISGRITKLQGFMGTVCSVGNTLGEFEYLKNIINGNETKEFLELVKAKKQLKTALIPAIRNLTPYDFEILIDLIFREIGWKRTSIVGAQMKDLDLVLEEPFSHKLHAVQIKSKSNLPQLRKYIESFNSSYKNDFESFFYFVHTPDDGIEKFVATNTEENIRIVLCDKIADYVIDYGLIKWIMEKTK